MYRSYLTRLTCFPSFFMGFVGVSGLSVVCSQHLSIRIPGYAYLYRVECPVPVPPRYYFFHLLGDPDIIPEASHSLSNTCHQF